MWRRRNLAIVGAIGLAALGGGLFAAQTSSRPAVANTISSVSNTIKINANGETFAPPPANAAPALTAQQAWAQFIQSSTVGSGGNAIPSGTTVQLGLFTFAVGPSSGCGT